MPNEVVVLQAEAEEQISPLVQAVEAVVVDCTESEVEAAGMLVDIRAAKKTVTEIFADPKAKAYAAHQSICKAERTVLEPLTRAESHLRDELANWESYRVKLEEEARAAKRAEEVARLRAAREAEEARNEQIVSGASEGEGPIGDMGEADETRQGGSETPQKSSGPTYVPPKRVETPVTYQTRISADVTDFALLVQAVSQGFLPMRLLQVDKAELNRFVQATHEVTREYPGIEVIVKKIPVTKRGG